MSTSLFVESEKTTNTRGSQTYNMILNLSPELRNKIYDLIKLDELRTHVIDGKPPGLLATCRQLRIEFSSVYFTPELWHLELCLRGKFMKTWEQVTATVVLERIGRALPANSGIEIDMDGYQRHITFETVCHVWTGDIEKAREHVECHPWYNPLGYSPLIGFVVFPGGSGLATRTLLQWK